MLIPKKVNKITAKKFFKDNKNLYKILLAYSDRTNYSPDFLDLYSLYQIITLNKRTTILEFGSGCSTLVFADALSKLKLRYNQQIKKIRRANPFEIFYIENEKKYFEYTEKNFKLLKYKIKCNPTYSPVVMTKFQGYFCTEYLKLPRCNPDFIYLDGPGQDEVLKNVNNFTISKNIDMSPMSCDILKFEFFLIPGTIIVIDGRGANALFLKKNLRRNWVYEYSTYYDQHYFHLKERPFGPINKKQLNFYKKN
jgi:hypothetical protein